MCRFRFIAPAIVVALLLCTVAALAAKPMPKPSAPTMATPSSGPWMAKDTALKNIKMAVAMVKKAAKMKPMDVAGAKKGSDAIAMNLKQVSTSLDKIVMAMTRAQKTKTAKSIKDFKAKWAMASKWQKSLGMELAKPMPNVKTVLKTSDSIGDVTRQMVAIEENLKEEMGMKKPK